MCTLGALSYASKTHCERVLFNFENKSRTKRRKRLLTIYHNRIRRSKKKRRDKTLSPGKVFETLELTIDEDDIDFQRQSLAHHHHHHHTLRNWLLEYVTQFYTRISGLIFTLVARLARHAYLEQIELPPFISSSFSTHLLCPLSSFFFLLFPPALHLNT